MRPQLGSELSKLPGPILITGHTGFKGAWLTILLEHIGIPTIGYSLPPEKHSLYERANLEGRIPELFADIRDLSLVKDFMAKHKPSAIIHMAAQPLVLESYKSPRETFDTNVMGTVNILDAAFESDYVKAIIVVTTDKVYRNDNSGRAFIESDPLEGKDPYSASKVGAEAAVSAWQQIAKISDGPKVVSVRAGNVIGGGDWAENRLIPDLIRGFIAKKPVEIRNPDSTRPWQHVLDPLAGYLMTLEEVLRDQEITALNFAPPGKSLSVRELLQIAEELWPNSFDINLPTEENGTILESLNLDLDTSLSNQKLGKVPIWSQPESIQRSLSWWNRVLTNQSNPLESCLIDIKKFLGATADINL